jgi:hypothetical protein
MLFKFDENKAAHTIQMAKSSDSILGWFQFAALFLYGHHLWRRNKSDITEAEFFAENHWRSLCFSQRLDKIRNNRFSGHQSKFTVEQREISKLRDDHLAVAEVKLRDDKIKKLLDRLVEHDAAIRRYR